jgi:hypothetical protein
MTWKYWIIIAKKFNLNLGMGLWLVGCASNLNLNATPKTAEIFSVDFKDAKASPNLQGVGNVTLTGKQLESKLYKITAPGYDAAYLFFGPNDPKTQIEITLQKPLSSPESKIAQAESQIRTLTKILSEREETANSLKKHQNLVGKWLTQTQRFLSAGDIPSAQSSIQELFKIPQEFLPSTAFTLRGKLHMLTGKSNEALADFKQAVSLFPEDIEAQTLIKTISL